ncbi:MAG: pyruvate dehydrogenase (acetyl-transferring), homodimeric type [Elusimicrobia bacterium CG1_02_63_36]|nr:MAG: pyruvate dehydrogenase (acetyl-transferring), homodimeric type [Elusimicrobia bacterium CG1_02_63_36]PIP83282.1 MAG: pyruvate dehydrogenase (acetyl-transferring), homodimeric type [Elusimicrobia bacterium CG22_combo_CG10-13_8_21_14_all_63_91]PJA14947.1 MAG: pyruvate dehydrogenase (acetyl-transferring), homodimeric type [Elusimicrobia bacterium CG_4_10_14_0_2_um_filter_63_34]PJB26021.1 MAG: pyruvate dehydrogenase (acetyl-transferring), homodimeric type [Elusimicrobia bacterium CG_4_9_14_3
MKQNSPHLDDIEAGEWIQSIDSVLDREGHDKAIRLLHLLEERVHARGVRMPFSAKTPFINSIPVEREPKYPGDRDLERRIRSVIRWNAMAMVVRANRMADGIGGHISTYASAATLYEVAFNHFFRAQTDDFEGDMVYFQGHASPGIYARAFLEGRLSERDLENFRRELKPEGGLSSYPHPWLMPNFWKFPTVSMGLGPLMAIYQARFNRYLEDRGLKKPSDAKVWAFLGDGETDEPESLGSISLAGREKLDNLIFVVNCNLQRLDGPVRGNGQIMQELEAMFRGAGWNVVKVVWGGEWDPLLKADHDGVLIRRMNELVDGELQKYSVESGAYTREKFFGKYPQLLKLVEHLSDEDLRRLSRGGHDSEKVYAGFKSAFGHKGQPTLVLCSTIKGYGLGEAGEGRNITHQQKKLNEEELREFRSRFGIPISDEDVAKAPFYKPAENSPEMKYLKERRAALGGSVPARRSVPPKPLKTPPAALFSEFDAGTEGREVSTTMVIVRLLAKLLKEPELGKQIVPIVPDEARTFGMEALFRQCGIYSHVGQLYEPVDSDQLIYYKETRDGQILEEGITEAGSMSSFISAGTAYSSFGVNMIPFFIYYSMFGLQRIGDLAWAAGDMRAKGFMIGATAGRTTLAGEGLQHQDGNSHLLAYPIPNLVAYDPAFAYELGVIIRDGIRRMYENQEDIFYYVTVGNENYAMPARPAHVTDEGILKGLYKFRAAPNPDGKPAHLLASGPLLNEALKAQGLLEAYGVSADVWSVTSYKELYKNARETERWNLMHPDEPLRKSYLETCLEGEEGSFVAVSDYVKALAESVARGFPKPPVTLGTDGFGRSETREALRDHFEVDARFIALGALGALRRDGSLDAGTVAKALGDFKIAPDKRDPYFS